LSSWDIDDGVKSTFDFDNRKESITTKNTAMTFSTKGINFIGYNLPMETFKINFGNKIIDGSVQYRVHMRTKGWCSRMNNGAVAGTTG
jgi:hypothetical protein